MLKLGGLRGELAKRAGQESPLKGDPAPAEDQDFDLRDIDERPPRDAEYSLRDIAVVAAARRRKARARRCCS